MTQSSDQVPITKKELVLLCARDHALYAKTFFPKTVRQETPPFHREMDELLFQYHRHIAFEIFRGGAKTSKVRIYTSKVISYAIAHTILLVSNAQAHSVKSLEWIKRQVEYNTLWASTYGLRKGSRWTGEDIEIIHGIDEYPIRLMAYGITGHIRGINVDDYRPDLIIIDDPDTEETTNSDEQIKKTHDLVFGALYNSLAPRSEAPHAKMILLQTPFNSRDLISTCEKDPSWKTIKYGCFDANGRSRWEVRFPTEELQQQKEDFIRRGQLALWMREMECEIIPEGGASFRLENMKYYDLLPDNPIYVVAIDPASSSEKTADDQVAILLAFWKRNIYVVDYTAEKGELPETIAGTIIQWSYNYQILGIWVEEIGYQRVLRVFIEKALATARRYIPVHGVQDRRRKADRIIQAVGRVTGYGLLYVKTTQSKLLSQYGRYSPLSKDHDDVLDALAMGIEAGESLNIPDWIDAEYTRESDSSSDNNFLEFRSCP